MSIIESVKNTAFTVAVNTVLNYLEKEPETNIPKAMNLIDKALPDGWYESQRAAFRKAIAEKGKEKIENKTYTYEEYNTVTKFVMMDNSENEGQEIKTKFYFDGNKLEYIKTIVGNKQELLKVDISDDVDNNLFEIPSEYKEM